MGGEAFGRLTWQGPGWAAGRRPGCWAGALESAPPRASGGQEQAGRGSPGPAARAPFPRRVLGALCSRESRRLRMTWWGSMQPLGHRVQIQGANVTEWGAPWDNPNSPHHQTNTELRCREGKGLVQDLARLSQATGFPAWTKEGGLGLPQQPAPCKL